MNPYSTSSSSAFNQSSSSFPVNFSSTSSQPYSSSPPPSSLISSLRPAGIPLTSGTESAALSLIHPSTTPPTPSTDPHFAYRREFRNQPGGHILHPSLLSDSLKLPHPSLLTPHGIQSDKGLRAGDCFYHAPESSLQQFIIDKQEEIYKSKKREPLGRPMERGVVMPQKYHDEEFRFGVKSQQEGESAKDIIFPKEEKDGDQSSSNPNQTMKSLTPQEESLITHPINRHYNWSSTSIPDPSTHRFGVPSPSIDYSGKNVIDAIRQMEDHNTIIVSSAVTNHQNAQRDKIGKSKGANTLGYEGRRLESLSVDDPTVSPHVFGKSSAYDKWGVRDCIRGNYKEEDQLPDKDLGKSVRRVEREREFEKEKEKKSDADNNNNHSNNIHNIHNNHLLNTHGNTTKYLPSGYESKTFGLPSIRHGEKRDGSLKSLANIHNYGDSSDGKGLLYPSDYANIGVNESEWEKERGREEIWKILSLSGMRVEEEETRREMEEECRGRGRGKLNVSGMREVYNERMLGIQKKGGESTASGMGNTLVGLGGTGRGSIGQGGFHRNVGSRIVGIRK